MTTDEQALRNAVSAAPHDWTPRLVLADYLDDTGEPHHAEEAARIRQAADPSTPLGRAVAASRRAWVVGKDAGQGGRHTQLIDTAADTSSTNIHDILHGGTRDTREHGLEEAATRHTAYGAYHRSYANGFRGDKHVAAGREHLAAAKALREYARTL